ncbi:hypothetical protein VTN00DRAFT_3439 [Thermoascus crustaceus]|uniref:uncharacterized protein n=1 Tax=Thermoascus crustaceus TaxID=5088 RepID=UPI003742BE34
MIINGQKWACEACVRGHRVTNCRHNDRPLIRINKKGRPFSICRLCNRSPCNSPEEHSKLRREADMGSSTKKSAGRYRRPSSALVPIAPKPATTLPPSSTGQTLSAGGPAPSAVQARNIPSSETGRRDVAPAPSHLVETPPVCEGEPLAAVPPSYLSVSPPAGPVPLEDLSDLPLPDDSAFPENAFSWFEDIDMLPEDWTSFFWSGTDMQSGSEMPLQ